MRTRIDSRRGRSRIFRTWESCRTMPPVGVFSRGSPVSPPFIHSSDAQYSLVSPSLDLKTWIYSAFRNQPRLQNTTGADWHQNATTIAERWGEKSGQDSEPSGWLFLQTVAADIVLAQEYYSQDELRCVLEVGTKMKWKCGVASETCSHTPDELAGTGNRCRWAGSDHTTVKLRSPAGPVSGGGGEAASAGCLLGLGGAGGPSPLALLRQHYGHRLARTRPAGHLALLRRRRRLRRGDDGDHRRQREGRQLDARAGQLQRRQGRGYRPANTRAHAPTVVQSWLLPAVHTTCLPLRLTGFDTRRGRCRILACGSRAGLCRWSAGFLGGFSRFPCPSIPVLLHTHLT
ncbi:hypothetical protein PR048_007555 [Dryococelus australis]|uniref:Uncharacterized protein n=1 Tax=Dryococelus australis TaxID=614101 RepID=A0ABQ9HVG4_9NEOP|nr:hypothetical protein PR048_007555 [Dryococelus australis]